MSLPSIRECLQRLDRMRDTAGVIADLDRLNAEMWQDEPAHELSAAGKRLADLHQVALHLAANINGGYSVPPTPVTRVKPVAEVVQTKPPAVVRAMPDVKRKPGQRNGALPTAGMVTAVEFAATLGVSIGNFYQLVSRGIVPPATQGGGRGNPSYWDADNVPGAIAARATMKPSSRPRPPIAPTTNLTGLWHHRKAG